MSRSDLDLLRAAILQLRDGLQHHAIRPVEDCECGLCQFLRASERVSARLIRHATN